MVDYLIVTFIQEEYDAVLRSFRGDDVRTISDEAGKTRVLSVATSSGQDSMIAIARTGAQGNVIALGTVLQLLEDQKPRLVLSVGIAGAPPTEDIFLGDVLLVNDVHDLTRGAETDTGREEAAASTYLMQAVKDYVANVTIDDFRQWREQMESMPRPAVEGFPGEWTGDPDRDDQINRVLAANAERLLPTFRAGAVASADTLVKSDDFMQGRLRLDRGILGNDMESVGVARACETAHVPLLVLRAISDIVGYPRSDLWKHYACGTAAAFARELVRLDAVDTITGKLSPSQAELPNATSATIETLTRVLARIRQSAVSDAAIECRKAFSLFQQLPAELKRPSAPALFQALDRPMKYLGDKRLVFEVAEACIACCSGADLDDTAAECQARARICGTSWVHQRTGKLGLAEQEANEAVRISEGIQSTKNLAFCKKCLGRLKRMQAETAPNVEEKSALFKSSLELLHEAIDLFGKLDDDSEVGDCLSLRGRTYLSMGNVASASDCAAQAKPRIEHHSKDYLDLCILEGDLFAANREFGQALASYQHVIDDGTNLDYQISEIMARAYRQKGRVLMRLDRRADAADAFEKAKTIWSHYGEADFAAEAEWERICANRELDTRTIRLLEREATQALLRCEAVRVFEEESSRSGKRVVASRVGHDDAVWRNLLKRARRRLALQPPKD